MGAPLGARAQQAGPAEFVFRGGKVLTMSGNRVAEAVAVAGGRITYVGSDSGAGAFVGAGTEVVELRGRTLMPGIHDGHMHPLSGGISLTKPTLNYRQLDLKEFVEAIRKLLARTSDQEPDGWLSVDLWDPFGMDRQPTKEDLDRLPTRRPILVIDLNGHTAVANSRALELAGIRASTPDPPGGRIKRGAEAGADRHPVRQRHHTRIPEGPVAHDSAERGRAPGRSRRDRQEGNHLVPRRLGRRARARGAGRPRRPRPADRATVFGDHRGTRARR